jgi:DNA ligase-associated metallophosphoesterase
MRCVFEVSFEVNGEELTPDPSGALWWRAERTLIFADIHFEKGSSYARRGALLPPYDTRATLARLTDVLIERKPARVIALGDSFHDGEAADRLDRPERSALYDLTRLTDWIWIEGNHDPRPPGWLGGTVANEIAIGGLIFRHEPQHTGQAGEVAGHLHPCATVSRRGRSIRRRCFISDGQRAILPSFGAYTGGLDVRDAAITSLFPQSYLTYVLGNRRVYAAGTKSAAQRFWRKSTDDSQPSTNDITTADTP